MSAEALGRVLHELHEKWQPHDGQVQVGEALFYKGYTNIFGSCGRNWGKTDVADYCLVRWAASNPSSENYYFAPYMKQAREIVWQTRRLQNMIPQDWIESVNETEMRIRLKNGSYIKCEGSDNVDSLRGVKPKGLIIYDEIKDMKKSFLDAFEPNRAAFNAPAIFLGTPPEFHNHYVDLMEMAQKSKDWFYFNAPTSSNPYISKDWLDRKKAEYETNEDIETWQREFEGIYVLGGKRHIIPQALSKPIHKLSDVIPKDLNKWNLVIGLDPASTSVFGVIMFLHNPYTKKSIPIDEIYEDRMEHMTSRKIYYAVEEKSAKWRALGVNVSRHIVDSAAAWFTNEINEITDKWWIEKSDKKAFGIEGYIQLLKTLFNHDLLILTDAVPKFIWEIRQYVKDEKGNIPDKDDHLINAASYAMGSLGYNFDDDPYPKEKPIEDHHRASRIEDDFKSFYSNYDDISGANYDHIAGEDL
jgi:hypothetical protein